MPSYAPRHTARSRRTHTGALVVIAVDATGTHGNDPLAVEWLHAR